ncbi:MAG: TRAP transporter permease [Thalassobaculum sp.]
MDAALDRVARLFILPFGIATALGMSAYHLWTAYVGTPQAMFHYPVHVMFALAVLFLYGAHKTRGPYRALRMAIDLGLVAVVIWATGYLFMNADYLANRFVYVEPLTPVEMFLGIALMGIILEAARRTIGWVLVWLTLAFIVFALFGNYLPEPFYHRGFTVERIVEQSYMTPDGIWNVPIAVTANFIFLFVLLGAFLLSSGAGSFFTDLARALTGRLTGGPAKTAVVASGFMGMLSGSSPANVVTTGSFTIPAMRKAGYDKNFAAGVEAVASSGGQITPPIMGSAAFLMIEFVGIPYFEIMSVAIIPAILFFIGILAMTDLEARRLNLRSEAAADVPRIWPILRARAYLLGPIIVMVWLLMEGYTPTSTGFYSIVSLAVLLVIFDPVNRRRILSVLREAMIEAPRIMGPVTVASAIGGVLAGIILMTGLGIKMSEIILDASQGILIVALLLTMVVAVVLGMGMPTASAYIILAILLAPGLEQMGVPLVAAHLFIVFCAAKSSITPPVAVSSYAAAAIAGSDPWRTSLVAFKLGISGFIIPFMFVYSPELLGQGTWYGVAWALATASVGVIMVSAAAIGWLHVPLRAYERVIAIAIALMLMVSDWRTDLAGLALLGALAVALWLRQRQGKQAKDL